MAYTILKKQNLFLLLIFISSLSLYAHPHMKIQAYSYNYFNENGLQGVYMQWEYDPMFSSQLIYNYDIDNNMEFSADEALELKIKYFDNIVDSNYYTYFYINDKLIENPEPVSFKAVIDKVDVVMILSFFVPLNITKTGYVDIRYGFNDKSQYTAFFIPQSSIRAKGEGYKLKKEHINQFGEITYSYKMK
ncbi:DUF1007 family protein [Thiospirochaeta perfilievii]|uniref:DUF1007 family protein n=1 Tax=Thiospirochaeta perfilievii TaxID=252967 RepID=A0A5C1Q7C7_9SPIO|nr:DUF1007 family protein [Thiospirochaeta perfilievii]QEN03983.1 DUF1007 family protein [Thiospirochaeta perfilievii]